MFKKVLIANRGEIALRVIRACRELGIATVAVHSTVDESSLHVKLADESVCIGPAKSNLSYLNIPAIISAAELTSADAIHPGYGFLSENAEFARICAECGINFIGPKAEQIQKMGDKATARKIAKSVGIPLIEGTELLKKFEEAKKNADKIGYPVVFKATAGGGGRGIQIVFHPDELRNAYERVQSEAKAAFGIGDCYLEKFCKNPRHVEVQVLCDLHGTQLHLGERDCSIQRRHQKLIEEAPSPILSEELRKKMVQAALKLCKKVGYINAGTVEFLVDQEQNFFFLEMNTRVQVEHAVTEMITGVDIVKEQIRIAAGEKISFAQEDIKFNGHAMECRINAEDSEKMSPSPGKIISYHEPGGFGVRVDSFLYQDYTVLPYYDSMVAKIICHGKDRAVALAKMDSALSEYVIEGIQTNIQFQRSILQSDRFKNSQHDTNFLQEFNAKST